jgi:hypothetical protein
VNVGSWPFSDLIELQFLPQSESRGLSKADGQRLGGGPTEKDLQIFSAHGLVPQNAGNESHPLAKPSIHANTEFASAGY